VVVLWLANVFNGITATKNALGALHRRWSAEWRDKKTHKEMVPGIIPGGGGGGAFKTPQQ
jgi:hypothetical protein